MTERLTIHSILKRARARAAERDGAAAVEFALLAIPFFLLIIGLLEVSLMFIAGTMMDHAAGEAARQIRTGEVQGRGDDANDFRTLVCDEIIAIVSCGAALRVDVRTFADFDTVTFDPPIDDDGEVVVTEMFNAGGASEIVVVRIFYEWNMITPMISKPLANLSGNRRLLQSTVAFRNEPF